MVGEGQFHFRWSETEMQSNALAVKLAGDDACRIALVLGWGLSCGVVASLVEHLHFPVRCYSS